MITLRQIQRIWDARDYNRLTATICEARPDVDPAVRLGGSVAAAACAIVRMDEFGQSAHPLVARLIRHLLQTQQPDGGWGDVAVTAIAVRALRCCRGDGRAISDGIDFLALLQREDGAWPAEPIRRLSPDAATTSFILMQLGNDPLFRERAQPAAAANWLRTHQDEMDAGTRQRAERAISRMRPAGDVVARRDAAPLFAAVCWS